MTKGAMTRRGRKPVQDELTGDLFASLPETEGEPDVVLPTDVAGMLALLARWHEEGWLAADWSAVKSGMCGACKFMRFLPR